MSERKVLNKYYPPDFDPSKIPKVKGPKNRTFSIRIMAPFNMRCDNCGEYIYKGKKFNSRKETVEDEDYLGLRIFRFYIKCPRCVSEIAFKTDLVNTDYTLEAGAKRNFEASKTAELMAKAENKRIEEEELNNPMKALENRTAASQLEMEQIEALGELKELNARHADVNTAQMLELHKETDKQFQKLQDEEDEKFINSLFGKNQVIKRLDDTECDNDEPQRKKIKTANNPTDILTEEQDNVDQNAASVQKKIEKKPEIKKPSVGISTKQKISQLVKKKASKKSDTEDVLEKCDKKPVNESRGTLCQPTSSSTGSVDMQNSLKELNSQPTVVSSGLLNLGNYSDSEEEESD